MDLGDGMTQVKAWEERACSWGAEGNSVWLEHYRVSEQIVRNNVRLLNRNFVKTFQII